MDESTDKKKFIVPAIAFFIGLIIGSLLTILLFPTQCPVPQTEEEVVEQLNIEDGSSTEEILVEQQSITSDTNVSLPISQCSIVVDIAGAINNPGVYCFKEGAKIVDVVERAQGFAKDVAYKYVSMKMNLSDLITNHQKLYIPFEEDVYCEIKNLQYTDIKEGPKQQAAPNNNQSDSTQTCININSATKERLTSLNGVGESTAQKIIDGRPYSKVEDILNVSGIGQATYDKFKNEICVY